MPIAVAMGTPGNSRFDRALDRPEQFGVERGRVGRGMSPMNEQGYSSVGDDSEQLAPKG